ncbi:response regulator receiver modulated diguanylate cyclase [Rhodopseudomonas palustris HaA2]|uniref:Response regulator receiver modulated diguanylate cyclase n=1 Tax=Rhodopseudomonas palustris (strain HaA2) TaxID=316058 RepID=Q2ISK9_RHOP2|nr:response regulator [Rhodopseudomonas palustris]ABD08801.1 response regulator receiver modulated diguanylate cyclase [Rhodopseudomonas palustris HaA2]
MRILVIDDSEDGRDVAEAMLIAAGYEDVQTSDSAADAYQILAVGHSTAAKVSPVDLILMDIMMPEIDGIEACARIRGEPHLMDVPIIMVTLLDDVDSLANAFVAGATDYITKPLKRVELHARVRSALKLKSELDRRRARERELLEFLATLGDRRTSHWIDEGTGLIIGEVAEAYLTAENQGGGDLSVIALGLDRLEALRQILGDAAAANIVSRVARLVRAATATVGVVAGAYRNGTIVLIVPELPRQRALDLGEALRAAVSDLRIAEPEATCADHATASVAVVTGRVDSSVERIHLLTRAMAAVSRAAAEGGDRIVSEAA